MSYENEIMGKKRMEKIMESIGEIKDCLDEIEEEFTDYATRISFPILKHAMTSIKFEVKAIKQIIKKARKEQR